MRRGKNWTAEEKEYLAENWGTVSVKALAKNLGRSENGIKNMHNRMGLGAFLENGDYISLNQLIIAVYGSNNHYSSAMYAFRTLPVRKKRVNKCCFKVTSISDFWEWAEDNKARLDFSRMEENILGEEPEWVKVKRKTDSMYRREFTTKPWTEAEDRRLARLVREGNHTINQLSVIFHRREQAIKRRMYDLCLDVRPPRNIKRFWTEEETQELLFLREEGHSFEFIGRKLDRSAASCRGKMELLENPEKFNNRRRKECKTI